MKQKISKFIEYRKFLFHSIECPGPKYLRKLNKQQKKIIPKISTADFEYASLKIFNRIS